MTETSALLTSFALLACGMVAGWFAHSLIADPSWRLKIWMGFVKDQLRAGIDPVTAAHKADVLVRAASLRATTRPRQLSADTIERLAPKI